MIRHPAGAAAAFLLLVGPPAAAEIVGHPRELRFPELDYAPPTAERHELDAGPVVFLVPDRSLPLVELAVALRIGSFLEGPEETGLAELTAALMRRGGAGSRDADELDESLAMLGAELDLQSGETRSGLRLSVPSWELEPALDLVFDVLARPRWQEDRLAVMRENLTESMGRRNQDPLAILQREWSWILFGDFYATRRITPATLSRIDRASITAFHRRNWRPEALLVAASGDFDGEWLLAALERRVSAWIAERPAAAAEPDTADWPPPRPPGGSAPGLYLAPSESPQAKILLGHPLTEPLAWDSRERVAVEVLQEILGGSGAISRLNGRLRTSEGLVYRTWANLEPAAAGTPGYFRVFLETDPERAPRAIALAREEIERIRSQGVHPRELQVVRRTLLDRLPRLFDSPEKIAGRLSENELLGRPADYWNRRLEHLGAVSREEVRQVARKLLRPDRLRTLVVCPPAAAGAIADDLGKTAGAPATTLPARDPLTLRPLP